MKNKKTLKGVIIYLALTFAVTYAAGFYTASELAHKNTFTRVLAAVCAVVIAFAPAICAALTRLINKEGFKDMRFRLNFKGNKRYYLTAALTPIIYGFLNALAAIPFYKQYVSSEVLGDIPTKLLVLVFNASLSLITMTIYLGEELGWRDYLYPRLAELMGTPAAMIVGGIIWGLWHMPMHVFAGGMSWAEFAVFCVFTTVIGAFYHWLTMRTNSIYPACIAHSLNNNLASMLFLTMIFSEQGMGVFAGDVGAVTLTSSMTPVVAAVFILIDLLIRKKLKNKQTA